MAIASEFEKIPPTTSPIMKTKHSTDARINFRRALKSKMFMEECTLLDSTFCQCLLLLTCGNEEYLDLTSYLTHILAELIILLIVYIIEHFF